MQRRKINTVEKATESKMPASNGINSPKRESLRSPIRSEQKPSLNIAPSPSKMKEISKKKSKAKLAISKAKKGNDKPSVKSSKTPKSTTSSKINLNTMSSKKKNLEQKTNEIQLRIEKLTKERQKQEDRLNKIASDESIKLRSNNQTIKTKEDIVQSIESAYIHLDQTLSSYIVDDAVGVWDFLNTFGKQLGIATLDWDDFIALLNFTDHESAALTDIFCSLLKFLFNDTIILSKLNKSLPKSKGYIHKIPLNVSRSNDNLGQVEKMNSSHIAEPSMETFDDRYNGLRFLTKALKPDYIDNIRYQAFMRTIILRLNPVRRLRKAISDIITACNFRSDHENAKLDAFMKDLKTLTVGGSLSLEHFSSSSGNLNESYFIADNVLINDLNASFLMEKVNERIKGRSKSFGLNKDSIFSICASVTAQLNRINKAALMLESNELHRIPSEQKITLLKVLCDSCFDTSRIIELMEGHAEERANEIQKMNRMIKEQKLKIKEVALAKREAAIEACRKINEDAAKKNNILPLTHEAVESKQASSKKAAQKATATSGGDGALPKDPFEPTADQIAAMIEDLVVLEAYGVDLIIADPELEPISDDESIDQPDDYFNNYDSDEEQAQISLGLRRSRADVRAKANNKRRLLLEKQQRNGEIQAVIDRLTTSVASKNEKELRAAIKMAERSGFRGKDDNKKIFCMESLKLAYRALNDIESKAKDEKQLLKYEKSLEGLFVRTVPLGTDRNKSQYWRFVGNEDRLFIQTRNVNVESATSGIIVRPPTEGKEADLVLNRLFASRPSQYFSKWTVMRSNSELWHLCETLDDSNEVERNLKAKLKACFDVTEPSANFLNSGSEWIGRYVKRTFGRKEIAVGLIVGWAPATAEDPAIWHVLHSDGDEEDLDEEEVRQSLLDSLGDEPDTLNIADSSPSTKELFRKLILHIKSREEEPRIVRANNSLARAFGGSRNPTFSSPTVTFALRQELGHFLQLINEALKSPGQSSMNRDSRKVLENSIRMASTIGDFTSILLELELVIYNTQTVDDRCDAVELGEKEAREQREMEAEGWLFDSSLSEFIGAKVRRFFPGFGKSDGIIKAYLPAQYNDGASLFRMVHSDGDQEDLDESDLEKAMRYFAEDCMAENIPKNEVDSDEEGAGEEQDDSDDGASIETEGEESEEFDSDCILWPGLALENSKVSEQDESKRLWTTKESRERWQDTVQRSTTLCEIGLAIAVLEEHSYYYGFLDALDPYAPLALFSLPHATQEQSTDVKGRKSSASHTRVGAGSGGGHSMLSPRKAKKRAMGEIARCSKELFDNSEYYDEDDFRGARNYSKRIALAESGNAVSNSGRVMRAAAARVVSYTE